MTNTWRDALDIPGWMSEDELIWLAEQAAHSSKICEVGIQ